MYLYSVLYYYMTILSSTTSHVLLSANTEDLRTLAKQFVSDSVASNIYEMVKDVVGPKHTRKSNLQPEFREEDSVRPIPEPVLKHNRDKGDRKSKNWTTHYEVDFNELVEQVKLKLQSDFTRMAEANDEIKTIQQSDEKLNSMNVQEDDQLIRFKIYENQHENKSLENEFHEKEAEYQTVDQKQVTQQSKHTFDQDKLVLKPKNDHRGAIAKVPTNHRENNDKGNVKHDINVSQPRRVTTTVNNPSPFQGFNMLQTFNSSNDYVITTKEEDDAKPEMEISKTIQQNPYVQKKPPSKIKIKDYNDYEDGTTNYNKKKSIKNNNLNDKDNFRQRLNTEKLRKESSRTQRIQPYAEQLEESVKREELVTEEPKAKTENILVSNTAPHVKLKIKKKIFQDNVSSQREIPDIGSPNLSIDFPVAADKNLDNLIPEEDWVQDNFETV